MRDRFVEAKPFIGVAHNYLAAAKFLQEGYRKRELKMGSDDVIEHCFAHSLELAMKALLVAKDETYEPHKDKHRLALIYRRISVMEEAGAARRSMIEKIGRIILVAADEKQVNRSHRTPTTDRLFENVQDIDMTDLMEWYGERHSKGGGYNRYGTDRSQKVLKTVRRLPNGSEEILEIYALVRELWLESFVEIAEESMHRLNHRGLL